MKTGRETRRVASAHRWVGVSRLCARLALRRGLCAKSYKFDRDRPRTARLFRNILFRRESRHEPLPRAPELARGRRGPRPRPGGGPRGALAPRARAGVTPAGGGGRAIAYRCTTQDGGRADTTVDSPPVVLRAPATP